MRLSTTRNSIVITAFILFIFCVFASFMLPDNKTYNEIPEKTYEMILDEEFGVAVGE